MSTETPAPTPATPAPTPAATPTPIPTPPPTPAPTAAADEPLGAPGLKALQAERERAAAAEKALADMRKEIEDSKKTAEQKAADDLTAARAEATQNATKALRYEVATDKGLPLNLAARLTGSTREELEADAEALKALIPTPATPPLQVGPTVPNPGKTPGTAVAGQWTQADLKGKKPEEIEAARVAGLLDEILTGRAQ